jgi:hypothetical protein
VPGPAGGVVAPTSPLVARQVPVSYLQQEAELPSAGRRRLRALRWSDGDGGEAPSPPAYPECDATRLFPLVVVVVGVTINRNANGNA